MTSQPAEAAETAPEGTDETTEPTTEPTETVEHWKEKARLQEKRAKENAVAAKRLAEIEDAQKSEAQKAADTLARETKRADDAESRLTALTIAVEHQLGAEDAALLAALSDEDSMRALAKRLAGQAAEQKKQGNRVPKEGASTTAGGGDEAEMQEFLSHLTGR